MYTLCFPARAPFILSLNDCQPVCFLAPRENDVHFVWFEVIELVERLVHRRQYLCEVPLFSKSSPHGLVAAHRDQSSAWPCPSRRLFRQSFHTCPLRIYIYVCVCGSRVSALTRAVEIPAARHIVHRTIDGEENPLAALSVEGLERLGGVDLEEDGGGVRLGHPRVAGLELVGDGARRRGLGEEDALDRVEDVEKEGGVYWRAQVGAHANYDSHAPVTSTHLPRRHATPPARTLQSSPPAASPGSGIMHPPPGRPRQQSSLRRTETHSQLSRSLSVSTHSQVLAPRPSNPHARIPSGHR